MTIRATLPGVDEERRTISAKGSAPLIVTPVVVTDVHDGDSFHCTFAMHALLPGAKPGGWEEVVRVAHVNAAELSTPLGQGARDQLRGWVLKHALSPTSPGGFRLHAWGRDKYGRLVGDLEARDGGLLSEFMQGVPGSVRMAVREQVEVQHGQART